MKKGSVVTGLVLLAVSLFFLTSIPAHAQEKAMKLRLSVMWPPQHPWTKTFDQWGKDVEKATAGRITVTVFAASTLSPPMQVYDNTVKGVVDVGTNLLAYSADLKGLRIKANAENADIVKNLGASPVTMPVTETYDALSRGVVDGCLFPLEALQGFKIGEVVKTVLEDYPMSYMTSMYAIINPSWRTTSR